MNNMARFCFYLGLATTLSMGIYGQRHLADGTRPFRGNRLMSVKSDAGRKLKLQETDFIARAILPDGKMLESDWQDAQLVETFLGPAGSHDNSVVRVLFDREHIYLFCEVEERGGITAKMEANDEVISSDDYIQINLRPWLPDQIATRRAYHYSIAINPKGFFWDAYFDPYLDGFFFSSWNSGLQKGTAIDGNRWSAEMVIPFSGLDHYSNPGWKWDLSFVHSSFIEPGDVRLYQPQVGLTVEQGIRVRRPNMVQYYWTRPEFMEEVKPNREDRPESRLQVARLAGVPKQNAALDTDLWKGVAMVQISQTDRMGEEIHENTARARVGTTEQSVCFNLEADGARVDLVSSSDLSLGEGMSGQTASVNGVFVDPSLFANESFWIILQPRSAAADNIHQTYYLILVNNHGKVTGTRYDRFGVPDRSWDPDIHVDPYETASGWGTEISISFSSFDLPFDYVGDWGVNLFRNRLTEPSGSELQAWAFTATDFLNPETLGTMYGIPTGNLRAIRTGLERRAQLLRRTIGYLHTQDNDLSRQILSELEGLRLETPEELERATRRIEEIDHQLGVIETQINYDAVSHPSKGGYPILDVRLIGNQGWAVGAMGTILRTVDGGKSWQKEELRHNADLQRVFFVNPLEGWTAGGKIRMGAKNEDMRHDERGGYGYIFHTSDGGKTWECQYGERGRHLFGLYFINDKVGYACGELGFLLKTQDGGRHWRECSTSNTLNWLYAIAFEDELSGFAVGESETVIRTEDGGETWLAVNAPADRKFYQFRPFYRDIDFNGSTGCIVGQNGSILISHDAGKNWSPAGTFVASDTREFLDFTRVCFVTPQVGYVVGELGTRLMVTEDAGQSWTLKPIDNNDWLRSVWADPHGKVVAAGEREKILISNDRGFKWSTVRGDEPKTDLLVMLAHGDDAAIELGAFYAHYAINERKEIVDIEVLRDAHSVEYRGEIYNLEHHRDVRMSGVRTTTYFDEFENGNNGCDYYHFTERLWQGEENVVRHMVAAIRAYRPDVVIVHGGVFGDYDKPGHKLSGRAGIPAFETSGGETDHWPELTRLGLEPWQAKKLYALASESYPVTLDLAPVGKIPLKGTNGTCLDWAEYVIRNFQSQGVYHADDGKLSLIRSLVPVPENEKSVFDGLE